MMENIRPTPPTIDTDYQPIRGCDSDDSQSSGSRSEDNDALPNIIYTSDDSAEVGQSDSTYVDSRMEDELSQQLLLENDINSTDQSSPQVEGPFISHPLSSVNLNLSSAKDMGQNMNPKLCDISQGHLQVGSGDGIGLSRNNSLSSSSTETEFAADIPFLTQYEPLPMYPEDEGYPGGLNFNVLKEDPIKSKVIGHSGRFYVGDVPIDARYRDAFFVKWNWPRIRQTCVFINLSMLFGFLCVGVGLIVQMPKGSDCRPAQEWWQGTTSYYIFVPSFKDTNGNGFGDLTGIISNLDYLQGLGIKTIRLTPIFPSESFIDKDAMTTNYTDVAPLLGDARDLHLLAALLHERDMFLILDLPLIRTEEKQGVTVTTPAVDLEEVPDILAHWMNLGVDGFAFTDLHEIDQLTKLVPAIHYWRNKLDARSRGLHRKVMMIPLDLLKKLEYDWPEVLQSVQKVADMIDVSLDVSQPAEDVANDINEATRWDDHPSLPWINWRIGGPFESRISDLANEGGSSENVSALGFSLLPLFLPGSVTLYYGDEIGLTLGDENKVDFSWATPMAWSPNNGGFSKGQPWLSLGQGWKEHNVLTLNHSLTALRTMIEASQNEVPLYINGIFEDVGTFHPKKTTNYKIRYATEDLLIIDRFYPRRNKYAIVMNLGPHTLNKDLSKLYYGGRVLASSYDKEGYVRFRDIVLQPREALAIILDK